MAMPHADSSPASKLGFYMLLAWSLASIACGGLFGYWRLDNITNPIIKQQNLLQVSAQQKLLNSISDLTLTLHFMSSQSAIIDLISQQAVTHDHENDVVRYFKQLAQQIPNIQQMRWLDEQGQERIRITVKNGAPHLEPAENLQNKANRYYFEEAKDLSAQQIYVSHLDLNIENGELEIPLRPTLRFATPIFCRAGNRRGILVINVDMTTILDEIRALNLTTDNEIRLVASNGMLFVDPQRKQEWGFYLEHPERTFQQHYPITWQQLNNSKARHFRNKEGIWSVTEVYPLVHHSAETNWWQIIRYPHSLLLKAQLQTFGWAALIALVLWLPGFAIFLRLQHLEQQRQHNEQTIIDQKNKLESRNIRLQNSLAVIEQTKKELGRVQRLSAMGMMVSGVAHEMNTPVGSAVLLLSQMRQQLKELQYGISIGLKRSKLEEFMSQHHASLSLMENALNKIATLVHDFRQLALDRTQSEQRQFYLTEIVSPLHQIIHPLSADNSAVTLRSDIEYIPLLNSYPGPLGQILQIFVENAYLHAFNSGEDMGVITITAKYVEPDWFIEVADNGKGIAEEYLSQLFDPFFTTTRSETSMGLGLYVAHQLAEEFFNCTIEVESHLGNGTVFRLKLGPEHFTTPTAPI